MFARRRHHDFEDGIEVGGRGLQFTTGACVEERDGSSRSGDGEALAVRGKCDGEGF
jgi:hypothetical protein